MLQLKNKINTSVEKNKEKKWDIAKPVFIVLSADEWRQVIRHRVDLPP